MNIEILWAKYHEQIKVYLLSKVSNAADVEDLLQEIVIKAYNNLDSLHSQDRAKPWLFQIANRTVIDYYRKSGKSLKPDAKDLWYADNTEEPKQHLSQCVQPFIKNLPDNTAELLTAIDLDNQSQKDYAANHGISYSTLKSRVQKSRKQLRAEFEACCHISLDRHGNIMDFTAKSPTCKKC